MLQPLQQNGYHKNIEIAARSAPVISRPNEIMTTSVHGQRVLFAAAQYLLDTLTKTSVLTDCWTTVLKFLVSMKHLSWKTQVHKYGEEETTVTCNLKVEMLRKKRVENICIVPLNTTLNSKVTLWSHKLSLTMFGRSLKKIRLNLKLEFAVKLVDTC